MAYLCFYSAEGRGWGGGGEKVKQYLQLSCFQRGKRNRVHGEMQWAGGRVSRGGLGARQERRWAWAGLPPSGCLALGTPRGMPGEAEEHPGVASPPQFLVGPSRTRASLGTGCEPVSKLCVHPATPTRREGEAFLRPLRKGRLAWAPPGLCTAAGCSSGRRCPTGVLCCVSGVCPALGTAGEDLSAACS